jgi:hypothetical protein
MPDFLFSEHGAVNKIEDDHQDKDSIHYKVDSYIRFILLIKLFQSFEHAFMVSFSI